MNLLLLTFLLYGWKREYYNTIEEAKEARKKWIKKNFKAEIRGRLFYEEID